MRYRMGPTHLCVFGPAARTRYARGLGVWGPIPGATRSSACSCRNVFVSYCVQVVANPENKKDIVGPLPCRPNSRQPLDNELWAQQAWCDTKSYFRGNTQLTHSFLSVPRGAHDLAEKLSEELFSHDSGARRQVGARMSKQMCVVPRFPFAPFAAWAHQWPCNRSAKQKLPQAQCAPSVTDD